MSEYLLATHGLTKQFGHHKAVDHVDLHVKKGSIYGFIGRNGAGKTTFLKMISGLSQPTSGEIEMFGYKNAQLKNVRSRISCLIESPGLYGNMSAYDNLAVKYRLFGINDKRYIENILKTVGLSNVGKKKTKHFSLGMKQRLGIGMALVGEPDLLLLDLNLPVVDGHFICREVRKSSDMPIIIVTSRDSDMDELISMNLGADDFVTKPYNLQILLARIARVLQRTYEHASSNILTIHDIALDISKSTLTWKGNSIDLTKNELRIMHCLFQNKNKIVSRNELMQHMWDCDLFVDDNTLTVNINRLRKKLEYLRLDDLIQTKRGMGYIIYED